MSIIAYDGKTIAADKQATYADVKETTYKIKKLANGDIVGFTGTLSKALMLVKWYEDGSSPKKYPKFQEGDDWIRFVVFKTNGKILYYESTSEPIEVLEEKIAFGCGRDLALGAMEMGADAVTAVKVASKYSVYCGMGVDSFEFKRK